MFVEAKLTYRVNVFFSSPNTFGDLGCHMVLNMTSSLHSYPQRLISADKMVQNCQNYNSKSPRENCTRLLHQNGTMLYHPHVNADLPIPQKEAGKKAPELILASKMC